MRMTKDEIKLVTFMVTALLVGAVTKHYKALHPQPMMSTPLPRPVSGYPSSRRW